MTMDRIYIKFRGRVLGPVAWDKALELARRGQITRQHEVSPDGLTWQTAGSLPDLFENRSNRSEHATRAAKKQGVTSPTSTVSTAAIWYANFDGANQGPVDESAIKQWIGMGKVTRSTLIWRDGMPAWVEACVAQPNWFVNVPMEIAQPTQGYQQSYGTGQAVSANAAVAHRGKSKVTAGLLALFLGGLGIHKFYLGAWGWGILYLLFVMTAVPAFVALIDAIVYFTMSEQAFDEKWNYRTPGPFDI